MSFGTELDRVRLAINLDLKEKQVNISILVM